MLAGPHPRSLPLRRSLTRSSRRPQALFNARGAPPPLAAAASLEDSLLAAAAGAFQCSRGPTPARCRSVARRLAPRGGRRRFSTLAGPHPRSLPLGRSKTRSSRRPQALFNARGAPPPLAAARSPEDSLLAAAPGPSQRPRGPPAGASVLALQPPIANLQPPHIIVPWEWKTTARRP